MKSFLFEGNAITKWSFNVSHIGLPWLTFLWIHFIHNSHELWETVCPEIHDGQVQVHKHLQFCALWTLLKKDYSLNICIMLVKKESKSGHMQITGWCQELPYIWIPTTLLLYIPYNSQMHSLLDKCYCSQKIFKICNISGIY